jgi:hypothetical protein
VNDGIQNENFTGSRGRPKLAVFRDGLHTRNNTGGLERRKILGGLMQNKIALDGPKPKAQKPKEGKRQ